MCHILHIYSLYKLYVYIYIIYLDLETNRTLSKDGGSIRPRKIIQG